MSGLKEEYGSRTIKITDTRLVPVVIGDGVAGHLDTCFDFNGYSSIVLITDATVAGLYAQTLKEALTADGIRLLEFVVPAGERSKSPPTAESAFKFLLNNNIDRKALICILGGGVVGDLGGYIASTYLRGIDYIQLPTSLLAQVDSSIGGKVGVNYLGKKNMLGGFYQPRAVISDVAFLKSLPAAEMCNGMAEVIKYGITLDAELFRILEQKAGTNFNNSDLVEIVSRCVSLKAAIVEEDETERSGKRAILNFGHTTGHAIESAGRLKKYRHGEAVAIGIIAAARISERLGMLNGIVPGRIEKLLRGYGLPVSCPGIPHDELYEAVRFDKKTSGGHTAWVLLKNIGSAITNQIVPEEIVREVLKGIGK